MRPNLKNLSRGSVFHLKVYSSKTGAQLKPDLADLIRGSNLLNSDTDHFFKYVCNRCG